MRKFSSRWFQTDDGIRGRYEADCLEYLDGFGLRMEHGLRNYFSVDPSKCGIKFDFGLRADDMEIQSHCNR